MTLWGSFQPTFLMILNVLCGITWSLNPVVSGQMTWSLNWLPCGLTPSPPIRCQSQGINELLFSGMAPYQIWFSAPLHPSSGMEVIRKSFINGFLCRALKPAPCISFKLLLSSYFCTLKRCRFLGGTWEEGTGEWKEGRKERGNTDGGKGRKVHMHLGKFVWFQWQHCLLLH